MIKLAQMTIAIATVLITHTLFAQSQASPKPEVKVAYSPVAKVEAAKLRAKFDKFGDENLKLTIAHVKVMQRMHANQLVVANDALIKYLTIRAQIEKNIDPMAGPELNQKVLSQLNQMDEEKKKNEKEMSDAFSAKTKKEEEEFAASMKKRRDEFEKTVNAK